MNLSTAMLYHAHHIHHSEDLNFWLELVRRQDGPVLELACGTGRVLLPIAQQGYPAFGFDLQREMLLVLQQQISKEPGLAIHIWQADLLQMHIQKQFPLIILPCNTYSTFSAKQRHAILLNVHRHLTENGIFSFSIPNPSLLRSLPRISAPEIEESFAHPIDGEPVQVSSAWRRTTQVFTLTWYYNHLRPDGQISRDHLRVVHHLESVNNYREELGAAGLRLLAQYGDFDRSPYSEEAPNWIVEVGPLSF